MREAFQAYVQRVGELAEHVRGNEQATKPSLIGTLFQPTVTAVLDNPARSEPRSGGEPSTGGRIETTQEELAANEVIRRLLGPTRPVAYEDTVSYFKIHLAVRYTWVMCRLYLGPKR